LTRKKKKRNFVQFVAKEVVRVGGGKPRISRINTKKEKKLVKFV